MNTDALRSMVGTRYYDEVSKSFAMKDVVGIYERAKPGTEERSYEFLHDQVARFLQRALQRKSKLAYYDGLASGGPIYALPAPPGKKAEAAQPPPRGLPQSIDDLDASAPAPVGSPDPPPSEHAPSSVGGKGKGKGPGPFDPKQRPC